jgi:hypothetical protein
MRRPGLTGDIWPDKLQEKLLQAALLPAEDSAMAWREVRARIDVDHLPGELHRIMPLLSKALPAAGIDDRDLARLKGVYQFSWYRNTMMFKDAEELLGRLADASIPTMLLRGAAIVTAHRAYLGTRPMNDIDMLVPEAALDTARQVAEGAGWPPLVAAQPLERRLAAAPVRNSNGRLIRIHWQPSPNLALPHATWDRIWQRAERVRFGSLDTYVPSSADHLLHACVDGARANSGASLRWITDAMALLASPRTISWNVVVEEARRLRVTSLMYETLLYLQEGLRVEVPRHAFEALEATYTTRRDRLAHRLSLTTTPRVPSAAEVIGRFTRLTADRGMLSAAAAAPDFLTSTLDVNRRRDVPAVALKKLARGAISPNAPASALSEVGAGRRGPL